MTDKAHDEPNDAPSEGVVTNRRVVSRPMSWQDGAKRTGGKEAAAALEAEHPNAPVPTPRNDYQPQLKQMRRRHKSNKRSVPNYMSDIKL